MAGLPLGVFSSIREFVPRLRPWDPMSRYMPSLGVRLGLRWSTKPGEKEGLFCSELWVDKQQVQFRSMSLSEHKPIKRMSHQESEPVRTTGVIKGLWHYID